MRLSFLMARPADPAAADAKSSDATVRPSVAEEHPAAVQPVPGEATPAAVNPDGRSGSVGSPASSVPQDDQQPRERRTRAARASLSIKSMMEDPQKSDAVAPAKEAPAPSDNFIREKWPELAGMYSDKPRLASMLTSTSLLINGNDDSKMVVFKVVNQAQKDWVESKLLHELEGNLRRIVGSMKVYLRVDVAPDDSPQQKVVYMPSDQAKELMANNEQVKNLVKDLELDIK